MLPEFVRTQCAVHYSRTKGDFQCRQNQEWTAPSCGGDGVARLAYYEAAERPTPRAIVLAVRALSAGLDDPLGTPPQSRDGWAALVGQMLEYGGVPVVGRMLKSRDRRGLANFLGFVKRGPDLALFQSLLAALTRAQLAGLAQFRVAAG